MQLSIWKPLLFLVTTVFQSPEYTPSNEKSSVRFSIKNLGLTVDGTMTGLSGQINFDPDGSDCKINLTIDPKTIDTGIGLRDNHLKKEKYFAVDRFPIIQFESTHIEKVGQLWNVTGNLTIKGKIQTLKFPFKARQITDGYIFEGQFEVNRRDFNVGESSFSLSDKVTIKFSISTSLKK